jgi:hypothetical protein
MNPDPEAFQVNPDPIGVKGFDDQKLKKKLQFTYVQASGEDFSPQKRKSRA